VTKRDMKSCSQRRTGTYRIVERKVTWRKGGQNRFLHCTEHSNAGALLVGSETCEHSKTSGRKTGEKKGDQGGGLISNAKFRRYAVHAHRCRCGGCVYRPRGPNSGLGAGRTERLAVSNGETSRSVSELRSSRACVKGTIKVPD